MTAALDMQCRDWGDLAPKCGCPHEHWHVHDICMTIHLEPDGDCHATLFFDEAQLNTWFDGMTSLDQARPLALAWATEIIGGMAG